ncbi:MAG: hypothetical protein HY060_07305 [Proteobacteria bacterium]|nr:hypothetical protein [Pseudomonadota bacterium]
MGPRPARALGWVLFGLVLLAGPAVAADVAAVLKETLAGRAFAQGRDTTDPAAKPMFDRLLRGDYSLPALTTLPDLARLDRAVAERCPAAKPPSQLIQDSTPFLMTGQFDAKTMPPGARITASDLGMTTLELPSGRFLVYAVTLTGARIAPAPIVEARAVELGQCRASGDALSLVEGTTTDATIAGQGLAVIGGEPVWVVVARLGAQVGVTLQPLNRRLKNYTVGDGWKFLSVK